MILQCSYLRKLSIVLGIVMKVFPNRSLYIFYMQAKSYSEVEDSCLSVSITGDMGEARAFQSNQQDNSGIDITFLFFVFLGISILAVLDDESGDSDNEGDKERRVK